MIEEQPICDDRTADYSQLDDDLFYELLNEEITLAGVMSVPGVFDLVAEHYNNAVLELFEERYPETAFPDDEEEDL